MSGRMSTIRIQAAVLPPPRWLRTMSQIVMPQITRTATPSTPLSTCHRPLIVRSSRVGSPAEPWPDGRARPRVAAMARAGVCRGMRAHRPRSPRSAGSPDSHDDAPVRGAYGRGMLVPLAAIWVPTAVGIALAGGLLGLLVLWVQSDPGGPDDDPDADSDGGGGGRRRPRRPPPVGPVSWQDFERQFAAYVERRGAPPAPERMRTGAGDERALGGAGDGRRGG